MENTKFTWRHEVERGYQASNDENILAKFKPDYVFNDKPSEGSASAMCSATGDEHEIKHSAIEKKREIPEVIYNKIKNHPCYSEEAHHHFARMHIAVAPACNIQCNYCNRKYDCSNESRPGVVSEKLTPEQAVKKVLSVAAKLPRLSVIGIAGPGDGLANPEKTFQTFEMLTRQAPDLQLCLSTNGLNLPDYIDELKKYNIDHVTITINMIDPKVGAQIYPWIFHNHKRYTGEEAAQILSNKQMQGLEMLSEAGILSKINSVMIPGINDEHLLEVNKAVRERGAFLHNVMPLISEAEHGTYFGLTGRRGPTPEELMSLQEKLSGDLKVMKHCRQCRADAVGLLGEDRSAEFTLAKLDNIDNPGYNQEERINETKNIEVERDERQMAKKAVETQLPEVLSFDEKILIAVATKGNGKINEHFGHVKEFQIFQASANSIEFITHRKLTDEYCMGGMGDEDILPELTSLIGDCKAVLVAKIGSCPKKDLEQAGITAIDEYTSEYIEEGILKYLKKFKNESLAVQYLNGTVKLEK